MVVNFVGSCKYGYRQDQRVPCRGRHDILKIIQISLRVPPSPQRRLQWPVCQTHPKIRVLADSGKNWAWHQHDRCQAPTSRSTYIPVQYMFNIQWPRENHFSTTNRLKSPNWYTLSSRIFPNWIMILGICRPLWSNNGVMRELERGIKRLMNTVIMLSCFCRVNSPARVWDLKMSSRFERRCILSNPANLEYESLEK